MKKLREYYERELGILHGYAREFAATFPAQAMQLGMADGASADPHIERLIQGTALSNARTARLIDDSDSKFTEALLAVNYPHYLQPFPSTAIVQVDTGAASATLTTVTRLDRGALMNARSADGVICRFRTTQDVYLSPVMLEGAALQAVFNPPPAMPRSVDVASAITIDFSCNAQSAFAQLDLPALRMHIAGDPSLCATLRDALFLQAKCAYLELDDGAWHALEEVPLAPAGFGSGEAVLPSPASSREAYRLLTEYFAFPEKFMFIDVPWRPIAARVPPGCRRFKLHLGLSVAPDSPTARRLAAVSRANLLLGCTPVVNLFPRSACPIELNHASPDYELIPEGSPASAFDVYSVDKVFALCGTRAGTTTMEFRPYFALRHGEQQGRGQYYLVRRDPVRAVTHPGHETRIALVDRELDPLTVSNASVSVDLTCTNRDLPSRLPHGAPGGDLELEQGAGTSVLRFLHRPSPACRFNPEMQWRLIAQLSLSHATLMQQGVDGLREMLVLYDLRESAVTQRQIRAIKGLECRPTRAWLRDGLHATPVAGIDVRITVDEEGFAGSSLHLFAQVLNHLFGLSVHLNSFARLTVLAEASGKELVRCTPHHGAIPLV